MSELVGRATPTDTMLPVVACR